MSRRIVPWSLSLLAVACRSAPPPQPVEAGRGVIAFDPAPPAGAATYDRPQWHAGDRFTLLRGGKVRMEFRVADADARGIVIEDPAGNQLRRSPDFGYLGEWNKAGEAGHVLVPEDARYHWPLWVGKQWQCEYVDARADGQRLLLRVRYRVEDMDRVTVPAGTFDALRIVRAASLESGERTFFERTSLSWYAPAIGLDVRELLEDTAFELVEWTGAAGGK